MVTDPHQLPCVSVVTPVLNGADTLERNLESVWRARRWVAEHIIQDGGSSDGTRDILESWQEKTDGFVKPVSEPDDGIADGFNRGINRALKKGGSKWISILNADDWYDENAFDHLEPLFHLNFTILHGMIRQHRPDGTTRVVGKADYDPERHFRPLKTMPAQHPTCFVAKDVYEKVGAFDKRFAIAMDYDFLLRAHLAGAHFHYVPHVITNFTVGGKSSEDPLLAAREVMQSKIENLHQTVAPRLWYLGKWIKHMTKS